MAGSVDSLLHTFLYQFSLKIQQNQVTFVLWAPVIRYQPRMHSLFSSHLSDLINACQDDFRSKVQAQLPCVRDEVITAPPSSQVESNIERVNLPSSANSNTHTDPHHVMAAEGECGGLRKGEDISERLCGQEDCNTFISSEMNTLIDKVIIGKDGYYFLILEDCTHHIMISHEIIL